MTPDTLITAAFILILTVVIFMVLREFWTWYWKMNEVVRNQHIQNTILKKLYEHQTGQPFVLEEPKKK